MKNIFYALLAVMVVLLLGAGCQQVKKANTEPPPTIKIGVQDSSMAALVFLAKEKGYFVDEGVDVQIVKYPSGKKALEGMFNKEVCMATVADVPVVFESFNRNDFKIIASIADSDSSIWIVARKDANINKPSDLRGKKIGVQKLSGTHLFLGSFLSKNFIQDDSVEIVYGESAGLVDALKSGEVDAISGRNPQTFQAKLALGKENTSEFFDSEIYNMNFVLVASLDISDQQPEFVKAIVSALVRAEDFAKNNPEQSKNFLVKELGGGRGEEVANDFERLKLRVSLSQALLLSFENIDRWLIRSRFVEQKKIPNVLSFIYDTALESVKPEAVTIIK